MKWSTQRPIRSVWIMRQSEGALWLKPIPVIWSKKTDTYPYRPKEHLSSSKFIQAQNPIVMSKSEGVMCVVFFFLHHGFVPLGFPGKVLTRQH